MNKKAQLRLVGKAKVTPSSARKKEQERQDKVGAEKAKDSSRRIKTRDKPKEESPTIKLENKPKKEERGIIDKILKTEGGKFRTDLAGQFEQATGEKVKINIVPAAFPGAGFSSAADKPTKLFDLYNNFGTPSNPVFNPKNAAAAANFGTRVVTESAKIFKNPKFIAKAVSVIGLTSILASLGGKVFSKFVGMEEAAQTIGIGKFVALQNDNFEAYDIAREAELELLEDDTIWEKLAGWVPWKNSGDGLEKFRQSAITGGVVMDKVKEDREDQLINGTTDADIFRKNTEDRIQMEKDNIDYYNEQRLITEKALREAEENQRERDAAFWREERAKERKAEEADRQAIADFWTAYQKTKKKLQEDSRPSNLNFGLL